MTKISDIKKYINKELIQKIRTDLAKYEIGNERDLESITYYHLRGYLKQFSDIKISTNYTIKGVHIWNMKRKNGKSKWTPSEQIMPDIVISKQNDNPREQPKHLFAFELKCMSPGTDSAPNINNEKFQDDFKKLNVLRKKPVNLKKAYYLIVYQDQHKSEIQFKKQIDNCWVVDGKNQKRTKAKKFKIFTINRYANPKTKKLMDKEQIAKIKTKTMSMFRSYYGDIEPEGRKKARLGESNTNGAGKKAARTRERNGLSILKYGKKFSYLTKLQQKRIDKKLRGY